MSEGTRDAFIENDVIGNYAVGTDFIGGVATRKVRRKTRKSRRKAKHSRRKRRHTKRNRVYKKSRGGVKYTKNGQPYKILANGRARFIKGKRRK